MQKFGGLTMSKCNNCYHNKVCIGGANYKTAESCKHYVSAADVQEVRHGRWECNYDRGAFYIVYVCSKCGRETLVKENFCPNCGARMDGDLE